MKIPRHLAALLCGISLSVSLVWFHVHAADPLYVLTQPVTVDVGGQTVQLPVGQAVSLISGAPNRDGNIMIKVVLSNGSMSMAQIPATSVAPRSSVPAVAAAPVPPPAPVNVPPAAIAPASGAPAPANLPANPVAAAAPNKHNRKNAAAPAAPAVAAAPANNTAAPAPMPVVNNNNKKPGKETSAEAAANYAPGTVPWLTAPPAATLPPILAMTAPGGDLASVVPLFDSSTKQDPDNIFETKDAIVTRIGDRARDRHAREWMFHAYDHYLRIYWIYRTVSIEIVDRVAKGGDSITFNMTSLFPLNHPNLRMFFQGKGTVAQYTDNTVATTVDPLHYTETIKINTNEHRPLKVGDRLEFEFSPFLLPPVEGRTNYYGTSTLYVVGQGGTQPWEWHTPVEQAHQERNAAIDSYPIPPEGRLAGGMTLPQQYSDEPRARFQQVATNMAPEDIQPFMLGRRIHHTDMLTGKHSEPDNPVYDQMVGKLGPQFVGRSCIGCHDFNGAAMPAAVGAPMVQYAIHVGVDAKGTPHPDLGATLQTQAQQGFKAEGDIHVSSWTETAGTFPDGTAYSLRKPGYTFTGVVPPFFSVRLAPRLVGMGLLEAIDEHTIAALAAQAKPDGIKGRMNILKDPVTGVDRMGRFGWKANQATLTYQIAAAFLNDMGVTTTVFPHRDRGTNQPNMDPAPAQQAVTAPGGGIQKVAYTTGDGSNAPATNPQVGPTVEIMPTDLGNLYRYIALLGVPPRRDYADPDVVKGQQLFAKADCAACHVDTMKTSAFHQLPELRNQTIHPYTDMLIHDMGPGLADNMGDGQATGAEWRTTPLWGIGLQAGVTGGEVYLHDGRARNLTEAILWHGGEAEKAKQNFMNMSAADRADLIKFLQSL